MPLKAVLFDLDDTLFDHHHSCRTALTAVHQRHACFACVPFAEFEQLHSDLLEANHLKVLQGQFTLDDARRTRFRQMFLHYNGQSDDASVHETVRTYRRAYLDGERVVEGAVPLLERLRAANLRIGVVTNSTLDEQTSKLRRLKLEHLIDLLVVSEAVGCAKPDPRIFTAALEQLGCQPDEAVMIGDSWANDVLGSQAAGIRAVWFNRRGTSCPDQTMASEITAFSPLDKVWQLLFSTPL